jgi:hypothetical protein
VLKNAGAHGTHLVQEILKHTPGASANAASSCKILALDSGTHTIQRKTDGPRNSPGTARILWFVVFFA